MNSVRRPSLEGDGIHLTAAELIGLMRQMKNAGLRPSNANIK